MQIELSKNPKVIREQELYLDRIAFRMDGKEKDNFVIAYDGRFRHVTKSENGLWESCGFVHHTKQKAIRAAQRDLLDWPLVVKPKGLKPFPGLRKTLTETERAYYALQSRMEGPSK